MKARNEPLNNNSKINPAAKNKPAEKIDENLNRLKKAHPEYSQNQLEFYQRTAAQGAIQACLGRADESACVSSVAFIKGDNDICLDLEHNEKLYQICFDTILKNNAQAEINQCDLLSGDDYYNCLKKTFVLNNKLEPAACLAFPNPEVRAICQDILKYQAAYAGYNRELCGQVKNEKLNQYCLKNIIDKTQDSDKDGLADLDEINKYQTHYLFADTDGDGLTDGDEVNKYKSDPRSSDTYNLGLTDGQAVKRGLLKAK